MLLTSLGVITVPAFKATSPPLAYLSVLGVFWMLGAVAAVILIRAWRSITSQKTEASTAEASENFPVTSGTNHDKRNGSN
jgi:hypothetical protein